MGYRSTVVSVIACGVLVLGCSSGPASLEEVLSEGDGGDPGSLVLEEEDVRAIDVEDAGTDADAPIGHGAGSGTEVDGAEAELSDGVVDGAGNDDGGSAGREVDDRFAVPDVIDEEYAELVINELLRIVSDALRAVLSGDDPDGTEARRVFESVYGDPILEARLDSLEGTFVDPDGRDSQLPASSFGQQRFDVYLVTYQVEECVTAFGHYDVSETSRFPFGPEEIAAFILRYDAGNAAYAGGIPWTIWDSTLLYSGGEPVTADQLESIDNLSAVIDAECTAGGPE